MMTGSKSGSITVPSEEGSTYFLYRASAPSSYSDNAVRISELEGTGGNLVFTFDESGSGDPRSFFWVEKVDY